MIAPLLAMLALALGGARVADRVQLNDGTTVEGRVVCMGEDEVVVRIGTKDRSIPSRNVASVYARFDNQREAIDRWIALAPDDIAGALDLAQFCKRHDLLEELNLVAWWIVLLKPDSEDAHEFLGHEKSKGTWLVRDGGRRIELSKYLQAHAEWSNAFELRTTHYAVKTNLPLKSAITAAFALECHYRAFFGQFGKAVRLFDVTEPMLANVHGDSKSFPRLTGDRPAYFSSASRSLEVDASGKLDMRVLTHEATHAVLFATAIATRTSTGDIPAWLDEGLAEYMATKLGGEDGRLRFDADAVYRPHFTIQAKSKDAYDLSRLLNFESADFLATARADLKYAQAYSLVHFGLHADRGVHRAKFLAFIQGCYAGQASQSHFKDALEMEMPPLERAWTTYVKSMAVP
ncbi:MAG: DUF1570 domain-containing protein [Planctomycetota bacterium]|nr:DUF1570 domain-containing protein [Planctomycetota bacterium]